MALGWRTGTLDGQHYFHHAGGTGGFRSFAGFIKERQLGIVVLSNTVEDVAPIGEQLLIHLLQ